MTHQRSAPSEVRRDLMWLGIGFGALFLLGLGARDLWNPNEPLYGQAVVEMARQGEWLIPTVNGEVFDEKPILYFWLARLAALLTGAVDEFSIRLPSALAGLLSVLALYLLVKPYAGRSRAGLAAALHGTTYIVFWSARSVQMDMLLGALVLAGVLAATRTLDHRGSPWRGWSLAGLAAGAGVATKGPVALVYLGLVVGAYVAVGRRSNSGPAERWSHPALLLGAVVCIVVAAPWFVLLWLRGETAFLGEMLVRQNVTRFVAAWDHQSPWWYYLVQLWGDMAPWGLFLPLALALPRRDADERRLDRLAWCWLVAPLLFFSLSASKRSPYLLPSAPAVAILVSGLALRLRHADLDRLRRRACAALFGFLGLLLLAGGLYLLLEGLARVPEVQVVGRAMAGLMLIGGSALLVSTLTQGPGVRAPAALFAFIVSFYLLAAVWLLPALDVYKSPRAFCEAVNARVGPGGALRAYGIWKWRAGYVYYTGRQIPRITSTEQLLDYWSTAGPVYLIVERGLRQDVEDSLGALEPLVASPIGDNFAYLFSNVPTAEALDANRSAAASGQLVGAPE